MFCMLGSIKSIFLLFHLLYYLLSLIKYILCLWLFYCNKLKLIYYRLNKSPYLHYMKYTQALDMYYIFHKFYIEQNIHDTLNQNHLNNTRKIKQIHHSNSKFDKQNANYHNKISNFDLLKYFYYHILALPNNLRNFHNKLSNNFLSSYTLVEPFHLHYNNFQDLYHFLKGNNSLYILGNYAYLILSLYHIRNKINSICKIFLYQCYPLLLINNTHFLYMILVRNYLSRKLNKVVLLLNHKKDNYLIRHYLLLFLSLNKFCNFLHKDKKYHYLKNILGLIIHRYNNYLFHLFYNNFLCIKCNSYYHQLKYYCKFYNFHNIF